MKHGRKIRSTIFFSSEYQQQSDDDVFFSFSADIIIMLIRNLRSSWSLLGLIFMAVISLKLLVQMLGTRSSAAPGGMDALNSKDLATIWLVDHGELVRKKVRSNRTGV